MQPICHLNVSQIIKNCLASSTFSPWQGLLKNSKFLIIVPVEKKIFLQRSSSKLRQRVLHHPSATLLLYPCLRYTVQDYEEKNVAWIYITYAICIIYTRTAMVQVKVSVLVDQKVGHLRPKYCKEWASICRTSWGISSACRNEKHFSAEICGFSWMCYIKHFHGPKIASPR